MIKDLKKLLESEGGVPSMIPTDWKVMASIHDDCMSYCAWNTSTLEGIVVDPKQESFEELSQFFDEDISWIAVFDTHTHADHVSAVGQVAELLKVPIIMHEKAFSKKVHLRVNRETSLKSKAGPIRIIPTPGHTPDGICIVWGPFLFAGDTVIYGDVGRDDLPGGSPEEHYQSLQYLIKNLPADLILLPGHDSKNGRASAWKKQRETNASLIQPKGEFIAESAAFKAPAPKLFKESLVENFK